MPSKIITIILKEKRECVLMGDFNINLLNYDSDANTAEFFDTMSAAMFQPLILQPTRVTSHSKTLIDNIFINKIDYKCTSGNLTATISDHFPQFSHIERFNDNSKSRIQQTL